MPGSASSPELRTSERIALGLFVLISFGFSWTIVAATYLCGLPPLIRSASMLGPAIAGLCVWKLYLRRPVLGPEGVGFRRAGWGSAWKAPLLFFGFTAASIVVGLIVYPDALVETAELADNEALAMFSSDPVVALTIAFAINALAAPLLNLPLFLGEEVGWRGVLNPLMASVLGRRGYVVSGVVWGIWHVPMICLMGLNYPEHPVVGSAIFIVFCTLLNIPLAAIYERSRNIIPLAYGHGIMNWTAMTAFMFMLHREATHELVFGPMGVVGIALLTPIAVIAYALCDPSGPKAPNEALVGGGAQSS